MNCPKCGNPIKPNMKFCAKCGTPVAPAPQQPVQSQQPMQQKTVAPQQTVQPIQQRTVAPQARTVVPQPMQSNNAVQPQPAKKKRKKKKNLGLRITAIILVIAVLAMGGIYLADVLLYKNEVQKEGYITDFPVLKKKTQLLVIDDKEFPVDEYEIKVEEHKLGGILKSDAFGRTEEVFKDKSSNPIYNINFPNDGNYRITLTGVVSSRINEAPPAENNEKAEEKTETIIIVIEVKVDDDDEKAIDKAAITSKEGDGPVELPEQTTDTTKSDVYLEATDADFDNLEVMLRNLQSLGTSFEYSSTDPNAYRDLMEGLIGQFGVIVTYSYIYGEDTDVEYRYTSEGLFKDAPESERDPLNKFGNNYAYIIYPAEKIDWMLVNIFNVTPDKNNSEIGDDYGASLYRYEDYYYVATGDGGDIGYFPEITSKQSEENNIYIVHYDIYSAAEDRTFEGSYKVKCALKEIDGKKYWSIFEIEKEQLIDTEAVEFNGHYYKVYDLTGKTWYEANNYCDSLGGHLVTITSKEEQDFIVDTLLPSNPQNLYWIGGVKNYKGEWEWITGEDFSYANWAPNEPNNTEGEENFIHMFAKQYNEGVGIKNPGNWNDTTSQGSDFVADFYSKDNIAFICEWEKPVV